MTKSVTITARVTPALAKKIAAYAKVAKRSKSTAIQMILEDNIEHEMAFIEAIQEGIDAAERGELIPHEEAMRQVRAHVAKRKREAESGLSGLVLYWTEPSLADLKEAAEYIAADNEAAANKLVDRIEAAAAMLCRFPLLGRLGKMRRTREFVVSGTAYILVYRPTAKTIQIMRVMHSARDWPSKRKRS